MPANDLDRVAMPGDPDLDFDVEGLFITHSLRWDNAMMLQLAGGAGRFTAVSSGSTAGPEDDADVVSDIEVEVVARYVAVSPELLERLFAQVVKWHDLRTPLHMTAAPGRLTRLSDPQTGVWVPIPRTGTVL